MAEETKPVETEKPKKRGETPEEITKLLGNIEKAEKAAQVAYTEWIASKDETKAAKGRYDIAISDLRQMVRTRERWAEEAKRQPLLHQGHKQKALPGTVPAIEGDWRKADISKLAGDVTEKDREKLAAANILTLGDLQDRMQKSGTFWHTELKGIGRAAADRVEDSFNAIVTEYAQPPAVEPNKTT
jgi:hypothetical protein